MNNTLRTTKNGRHFASYICNPIWCIKSLYFVSWGSDEQNVNIGLDNIFASNMHQAIILTTGVVVSWRIYAPFGFDKL